MPGSARLAEHFRSHAGMFGDELYGVLMRAMADDLDADGVVADICCDRLDASFDDFVQLRLLAGLHRIVLTGRAPELEAWYPNLDGHADPATVWPTVRSVLHAHRDELHEALLIAPQTNEPGRSAALLVGLFEAIRRSGLSRVRLLEPGASAGLNLLVDRYFVGGDGWQYGPAESPLRLEGAVQGAVEPVPFTIVERAGCDLEPIDIASPEGRLRLVSFVWPHQLDRHARLAAALQVAAMHPVAVERAGASDWLHDRLVGEPADGVLTVVWHSITAIYWPVDEVAAMDGVLAEAGSRMPVAEIAMESPDVRRSGESELTLRLWLPGAGCEVVQLGTASPHGVPVTAG